MRPKCSNSNHKGSAEYKDLTRKAKQSCLNLSIQPEPLLHTVKKNTISALACETIIGK